MPKMDIDWFVNKVPMTQGLRLRVRRYLLDRDSLHSSPDDDDWLFEYQLLEEDESAYHSRKLLKTARNLRIPTPSIYADGMKLSEDWERSGINGRLFFLSLVGEKKIRDAIREEEKYRSEKWARRIPYITALSGLAGTVTGLLAVLNKYGIS